MTQGSRRQPPDVSVVMPVRNGERFLIAALDSILGQTLGSIELIVVDDASTDASGRIVRDMAGKDERVRCLRRGRGQGIVPALCAGVEAARAPFIARMDADDIALPERLRLQYEHLMSEPRVVAVGGQIDRIDAEGKALGPGSYPVSAARCRAHLRLGSPFCHPAVMLRASALREAGGYRARHAAAEDYDLWLRMARIGELNNLPRTVLRYRLHDASMTATRATAMAAHTAAAYLDAFHAAEIAGWRMREGEEADWPAAEARLPAQMRMVGRLAYLRALALNGGIVEPREEELLFDSLAPLAIEARRRGETSALGFTLLRAARQFARAGKSRCAARLLGRAMLLDAPQVVRAVSANVLRPR